MNGVGVSASFYQSTMLCQFRTFTLTKGSNSTQSVAMVTSPKNNYTAKMVNFKEEINIQL